jgi:hypothetical protein
MREICRCHRIRRIRPAGLDEFFLAVGDPLPSRTSPPRLDKAQMEERIKTIKALASKYRTELLIP